MRENILEIRNLIPQNFCEKVIAYYDSSFNDAGVMDDSNPIKKNVRNCMTRTIIDDQSSFGKKLVCNYLKSTIFKACEVYKDKFPHFSWKKISQMDLLKYETNNFDAGYKYHVDMGYGVTQRQLSISIALNNDYLGGEFMFDFGSQGEAQYPQNVGDCLMFPSNFMFPHQVNKVTKGTRYAIIAWVV